MNVAYGINFTPSQNNVDNDSPSNVNNNQSTSPSNHNIEQNNNHDNNNNTDQNTNINNKYTNNHNRVTNDFDLNPHLAGYRSNFDSNNNNNNDNNSYTNNTSTYTSSNSTYTNNNSTYTNGNHYSTNNNHSSNNYNKLELRNEPYVPSSNYYKPYTNGDYTNYKNTNYNNTNYTNYSNTNSILSPNSDYSNHNMQHGTPMEISSSSTTSYRYNSTPSYSSSYQQPSHSWSQSRNEKGLCGLPNMGNTCYMNSALQCLIRAPPLSDYFKKGLYRTDINRDNPLGMHGKIAEEFARVLSQIWNNSGGNTSEPREFAQILRKFSSLFEAGSQHDAHELLAFVLDGLHEDLNRVQKKPATTAVVGLDGMNDNDVARESWQTHLKRNDSIVVSLLQGQTRSAVVCLGCQKSSRTFEPFMTLSLPLKSPSSEYKLTVDIVFSDSRPPERHGIVVQTDMLISQLTTIISETVTSCVVLPDSLYFAIVQDSKFIKCLREDDRVPNEEEGRNLHAYVAKPQISESSFSVPHAPIMNKYQVLLLSLAQNIGRYTSINLASERDTLHSIKRIINFIYLVDINTYQETNIDVNEPIHISISQRVVVNWSYEGRYQMYNSYEVDKTMIQNSVHSQITQQGRPAANLQQCLSLFTKEEKLDEEDAYFCNSCGGGRKALKKMDLWKLPRVLIVHLKRFLVDKDRRNKIDFLVDFPITGLNMSDYVLGAHETPPIYDLFAVSNHYGSLQSGHYTAYAKFKDEWFCFDDSRVSTISETEVKSPAAYILFYIQRDPK